MSHSRFANDGLTLLELVVVLAILAVLATVAVRSLEPLADSARYETTKQTLEATRDAIVDDRIQSSGTRQISGFVADIGRLPSTLDMLVDETGSTTFVDGTLLSSYEFQDRSGPDAADPLNPTGIDCSGVSLRCGWRGPYLNVTNPANGIVDGWGRPLNLIRTGVNGIQLNWTAVTPQYSDQNFNVENLSLQTVRGVISGPSGEAKNATAALVFPDPGISTTELAVMVDADATGNHFRFDDIPVGVRALVFKNPLGPEIAIRYIEVTPLQQANLPITITEF